MARRRIGFWYRLAVVVIKPLLLLFTKRDWRGTENIPTSGGFVTAVNHISYVDPLTYAHYQYDSGRVPRFLAKSGLFKIPFVGRVLAGAGQIPVYRDSADAALAFRAAVEAVEKGECVAVYPEGTITRDKALWPMPGKTGAARIALTTGAPVIPVAQWGAHELLPPYGKRPRLLPRKTMHVLAGPPVDLDEFRGRELTADVLRGATDRIMEAVTELLAELREEPAPPNAGVRKTSGRKGEDEGEAPAEIEPSREVPGGTDPIGSTAPEPAHAEPPRTATPRVEVGKVEVPRVEVPTGAEAAKTETERPAGERAGTEHTEDGRA
ncbi:1-acyl-sn-glycerol-3-phosphate acyltransferase [Embleya sp. NBC_00888]|uniref:lysophospholipid acyltransferase family protein n=1 Tax=Embleya sp. NBC_00888 TaxID=2975960 RepID=UPI00386AD973|nr:1-acyl-sn-glycerol-3-phosphate acyltransferase [Embleya sp. NBC_00888]